jgi:hypothetical protein
MVEWLLGETEIIREIIDNEETRTNEMVDDLQSQIQGLQERLERIEIMLININNE